VVVDVRLVIAVCASLGVCLLTAGLLRVRRVRHMRLRLRSLALEWTQPSPTSSPTSSTTLNELAGRLGAQVGQRWPGTVDTLAARVHRAGMAGGLPTLVILGWKAFGVALGVGIGVLFLATYGAVGLPVLILGVLIGWFGIDIMLARRFRKRRRAILRDLPTIMDLLVLSLEAGMGLDRALRTVGSEYRSAFSDEIRRVLSDLDVGLGRGEAFERMAQRVGLDDLKTLSRAIVQSEELGVSMVGVMQGQSRAVRLSRRRAAEAEALEAPIKMLLPMVAFILPTLFMLLLGPVGLRAGAALSGVPSP
jgi:tight adherence protein C